MRLFAACLLCCSIVWFSYIFFLSLFPKWFFSYRVLLACLSPSLHNSKISFSSSSWFCFVLQYHFQNVFLLFRKLSPSTNGGCRSRSPKKCARHAPNVLCLFAYNFNALFISLWIRAQPFPFVYTRTKFDYLKIPNSAASATRAGRPFCFLIIDFFAIIDSWKLITKKNRCECWHAA